MSERQRNALDHRCYAGARLQTANLSAIFELTAAYVELLRYLVVMMHYYIIVGRAFK